MKRELTPVPPGYDQFTPKIVRSNAVSKIVWHGMDAEAKEMEQAKEYLRDGHLEAVEIKMRIVREIRRQMKRNGPELLEQHRRCTRQIAEAEKRDAERGHPWPKLSY
jgi:hypothetical protein